MELLEGIYTRKSVRKFADKEIEQEKIDALMKAAMSGPSAINKQPWMFYVVKSEEKKKEVNKHVPFGKYKSPIIIVPCARESHAIPLNRDLMFCDLGAATENILLAAHALGLGGVWCAVYPGKRNIKGVAKALGAPLGITPYAALYIGYPSEDDNSKVKDKFKEKNVKII